MLQMDGHVNDNTVVTSEEGQEGGSIGSPLVPVCSLHSKEGGSIPADFPGILRWTVNPAVLFLEVQRWRVKFRYRGDH